MKVFVTREISEKAIHLLKKEKFRVSVYKKDKPIPKSELIKNGRDADAIIALLTEKFDKELIDKIPKCRIIANVAVGYNNIDIEYATKKKIVVTNTPDVLTESTSDLALALILACSRRLMEGERMVRTGKFKGWKPKLLLGIELKNKVVGIIGAGRIGTETAVRAKAFKTKIVYFSRNRNYELEKKTGGVKVPLETLLKKSDIISIHLPLNKGTYHLIDRKRLSLLKRSAVLVNTSRGEVIDEKELVKILKQKKIFSAGFDVYENEPTINPGLLKLDNVILLPHIGSATEEARSAMAILAAKNVSNVLKDKKALTPVNKLR
ncbi:MAG: D-glycerate dehydrogenase [Ignavibacteria bacterium GWC2_36_12]|nr:MAG: D-glycerate dehydrogenase [Ignavibacteria bacterium GWC2_36_12]OGV24845.1 MAG: D-glycerate dehydrogenase [Ignavibacteria bacterium RIFOXYA2_FULL_37_17]